MGSTASEDDREWRFSKRADDQFAQVESEAQERIATKLDDVVSSEWREPSTLSSP